MSPDQGLVNLRQVAQMYATVKDLSEADTRCKLIDKILIECLGWTEADIKREPHVESGYIDYKLHTDGITQTVLEAKRIGVSFEIPETLNSRNYKIKGVISTVQPLYEAIKQARSYCVDCGAKYAVVSNGRQFVIFSAFLPGRSWDEAVCIVFNSLEDIENNFTLFWNVLSKPSVIKGSLIEYLDKQRSNLNFSKLIDQIHNRDQKWPRNKLFFHMQPIANFVFTELLDEAKTQLLKTCYVYERSNRDIGIELESLFIDRLPYYTSDYKIKDIFEREAKAGVFEKLLKHYEAQDHELPLAVILGGVGCGKSTFLHRYFRIVQEGRESLLWYYIEFRGSDFRVEQIAEHVYDRILQQFTEKYANKLEEILNRVGFAPQTDDKREHIKKLFALLKYLKFTIVLVIDNVDQHDFAFQEKLFIFSNHLCQDLQVITILSIREETFVLSTRNGVFDAYHVPVFHVSSPNFLNMIRPRISFSKEILQNKQIMERHRIDEETQRELIRFFEILDRSLSKDNAQSRQIVSFFDNISVGNMREALRMFNNFIISGNTNISDMFEKEASSDEVYQISFHQLLKSIMLGEFRFYSSDRSSIANLFDFDSSIGDSHFNQLRILKYLEGKRNVKSPIGRGYITIDELIQKAEETSIPRAVIEDSLLRLSAFDLVAYDTQSRQDIKNASYVRQTPAGNLYLTFLIHQFGYMDNVIIDTPISDDHLLRVLKLYLNETNLPSRVEKAKNFIRYLIHSEKTEMEARPQLLQSDFGYTRFSEEIKINFNDFVKYLYERKIIDDLKPYLA